MFPYAKEYENSQRYIFKYQDVVEKVTFLY